MKDIHQILKKYWGYEQFRDKQVEIIQSVLAGKDTLGLLPTGGGKSICFQVPALAQDGICIVVSPLIALMKDQVLNLKKRQIKARAIISGMSFREIDIALDNCIFGDEKFLYISPERIQTELFVERVKKMKVNLIAVDEAHCISQWGYDFRPEYLKINELRALLPKVPVMALTATATPEVVEDIQEKLGFKQKNVFQKSFERKNLTYYCIPSDNKWSQARDIILKYGQKTGIVYVRNRKKTEEFAAYLKSAGVSANYYHAGLDNKKRSIVQADWIEDRTSVIVATNAFGMGIDKPNVRYVIHIDLPDTLEAYFQEAGRGGRDLKESIAILIHNQSDSLKLEEQLKLSFPDKAEIKRVYKALGNFLQLAVGSGEGVSYPFDFNGFCNHYKLPPRMVYSAMHIMAAQGYFNLSDTEGLQSRLKFEVAYSELYKLMLSNPKFEAIIKILVRSYSGIYNHYVKINEALLANKLKLSKEELIKKLVYLAKLNYVDYIPSTHNQTITFFMGRVAEKDFRIDKVNYEDRLKLRLNKIESVKKYVNSDDCRSRILLRYFGEKSSAYCGKCDHCKRLKSKGINIDLLEEIRALLEQEKMDLKSLEEKLLIENNTYIEALRTLIDEDFVIVDENNEVRIAV